MDRRRGGHPVLHAGGASFANRRTAWAAALMTARHVPAVDARSFVARLMVVAMKIVARERVRDDATPGEPDVVAAEEKCLIGVRVRNERNTPPQPNGRPWYCARSRSASVATAARQGIGPADHLDL